MSFCSKRILALDLDGTLLNSTLEITPANKDAIRRAIQSGVEVIVSTGRAYDRVPKELVDLGVRYAITANGSAVYKMPEKECLYSDCFTLEEFLPFAEKLTTYDILYYVFLDGHCYSPRSQNAIVSKMHISDAQKQYLLTVSTHVDDVIAFLKESNRPVQKVTTNFYELEDGTYKDRDALFEYLNANSLFQIANGLGANLECTKRGVSKAKGLAFLADLLHIPMENTIAIGDSENDLDIITASGLGVAMANASDPVKEKAAFITLSNDEDGVAYAIKKLGLI